ncbi:hypothetical protein VHEMI02147 [[Torrubiella] hemipterigena]|uniref:3-hydroxyacyl-CoA dehydrogenase n=1 Tax=[Torrubiella] hemipterigena TaxID=1531966 RepID=A0A0A1SUZ5_9HYPO|nr:hypothetical protein VHEMI02147 [[Torrubiella] hemipterigena]
MRILLMLAIHLSHELRQSGNCWYLRRPTFFLYFPLLKALTNHNPAPIEMLPSQTQCPAAVAILGAGSQGRRIAYMWSSTGNDVHLIDSQPAQLQASVEAVEGMRQQFKAIGSHGRIHTHAVEALRGALEKVWLIVECVPEKLSLKQQIIAQLDALAPEGVIIASNSSSYTCTEIIHGLELAHKSRVLSAHTYWPPETTAIEIMGHGETNPAHIETMMKECGEHGFTPFQVKQPSMGYIYNRIWAAIKREALFAAAEGAATPQEIDAIFKDILKTAKGPFEQMDVVGLDVVLDIENHYAAARPGLPVKPREYLQQFLTQGHLGVKSGRGFYEY